MDTRKSVATHRFLDALTYAVQLHGADMRKGTTIPCVAPLLSVCSLVLADGGSEQEAVAALLHDALEDHPEETSREVLSQRFGNDALAIVEACTDTPADYRGGPKPPWRDRKTAYLEHVRLASRSAIRVALADKLDNARSMLADYRQIGDKLWSRFNAGKEDQLWFYGSLVKALRAAGAEGFLIEELEDAVVQLGRGRPDSAEQRHQAAADADAERWLARMTWRSLMNLTDSRRRAVEHAGHQPPAERGRLEAHEVTLSPTNPSYAPIVLSGDDAASVRIVAEFLTVPRESYSEITCRHGRPVAAYLELPRTPPDRRCQTAKAPGGSVTDFARSGRPTGIEMTAPGKATTAGINRVLEELGFSPVKQSDLAPLRAAWGGALAAPGGSSSGEPGDGSEAASSGRCTPRSSLPSPPGGPPSPALPALARVDPPSMPPLELHDIARSGRRSSVAERGSHNP